jgi:histidine triad (HIT) family protein
VTPPARGCVFCGRIERGEYEWEDHYAVSFPPLDPVTPGHMLVVPKAHVRDALEHPMTTGRAFSFASAVAGMLGLESANLITSAGAAATQTVFHLHVHIVPRVEGDGVILPWTGQER